MLISNIVVEIVMIADDLMTENDNFLSFKIK